VSEKTYWSVEDCCWTKLPAREAVDADVPAQREEQSAKEPVEA
jgi:hypothetical protein